MTTSATSPPGVASEERSVAQLGPRADQHEAAARRCPTGPGARRDRAAAARPSAGRRSRARPADRAASAASKRRTTKNVSSGDGGRAGEQRAMPPAMRARSASSPAGSAASIAARSRRRRSPPSSSARSARSAVGERREGRAAGGVAVRGDHRRVRRRARRATSSIRRDLPRPGEPSSTARRAAGFATAASYTAVSRASSSSRPTNGAAAAPAGGRATPRDTPRTSPRSSTPTRAPALKRLPEISAQLQECAHPGQPPGRLDQHRLRRRFASFRRDLDRLLPQLTDAARSIRTLHRPCCTHNPEALIQGRSDKRGR